MSDNICIKLDKKISTDLFEYLLDMPCREVIQLVTALQYVPSMDNSFIIKKDLIQAVYNYLSLKPAGQVIRFLNAINNATEYVHVPEDPKLSIDKAVESL